MRDQHSGSSRVINPGAALMAAVSMFLIAFHISPRAVQAQMYTFNGNDVGWDRYDPLSQFGAGATFSFPAGGYEIKAAGSPSLSMVGPGRAGSLYAATTYGAQFQVSIDIPSYNASVNPSQAFGLLTRITTPGLGTSNGYALTYTTNDNALNLSKITGEAPSGLGASSTATLSSNSASTFHLVFTANGSSLMGQIFSLTDLTTPLATVSATDSTYGSGLNGVVVYDNGNGTMGADATFQNFDAFSTAVPEPGAACIFVVVLAGCRRGRSRIAD